MLCLLRTLCLLQGMASTLAALHSVDPASVGLSSFGKASGYNKRQVWRWGQQYHKSVQVGAVHSSVHLGAVPKVPAGGQYSKSIHVGAAQSRQLCSLPCLCVCV